MVRQMQIIGDDEIITKIQDLVTKLGMQCGFDDNQIYLLQQYSWPENIRELSDFIEVISLLHASKAITTEDTSLDILRDVLKKDALKRNALNDETTPSLPEPIRNAQIILDLLSEETRTLANDSSNNKISAHFNLKSFLEKIEIVLIRKALLDTNNIVAKAATTLGMKRTTLIEKMKKYKL